MVGAFCAIEMTVQQPIYLDHSLAEYYLSLYLAMPAAPDMFDLRNNSNSQVVMSESGEFVESFNKFKVVSEEQMWETM